METNKKLIVILVLTLAVFAIKNIYEPKQEETKAVEVVQSDIQNEYDKRDEILRELMLCESSGNRWAIGDNGDSHSYFQWQEPSLEDVMSVHNGERVNLTHEQFHDIAHNYEEIYYWTDYAYFTLGQTWRWTNCHAKITK